MTTSTGWRTDAQIVYQSLREEILTGQLRPGHHLREIPLAERFGVSRTGTAGRSAAPRPFPHRPGRRHPYSDQPRVPRRAWQATHNTAAQP